MPRESLFQYRAYSDHPAIKLQGERLFLEFQGSREREVVDKNDKAAYRRAFITALAGLYYGGAFAPDSMVRVPMGNDPYHGKTRLSPVFQAKLLKVLIWLHEHDYIERVAPPKQADDGRWIPAGYRLTTKWLRMAQEIGPDVMHQEIAATIKSNPRHHQYVVLKDDKKREIRLKPSPQKDFTIRLLTAYDKAVGADPILTTCTD